VSEHERCHEEHHETHQDEHHEEHQDRHGHGHGWGCGCGEAGHHQRHGHGFGFGFGWGGGHRMWQGMHPGWHRRFFTREERIAHLQEYLEALRTEANAVQEAIAELKAAE
jgi:hypothetical protein